MKSSTLVKQSLTHYWRTNLAVVLGVATAVAVFAGALLVGDSVRASLKDLFLARLGNTDYLLSSTNLFREQFADDLKTDTQFAAAFKDACPIIALNGFVTHEQSGRRASRVQVYGVDERFWQFHGKANPLADDRDVAMSEALANELASAAGDSILLRIEKPSAIPAGSLHGRKEDLGRTIRLTMRQTLTQDALGEFSVRPQQTAVRAIFVSMKRLQRDTEQAGKANAILISQDSGFGIQDSAAQLAKLERMLRERFALEDLGLKLRALEEQRCVAVESDSAILTDDLIETAEKIAKDAGMPSSPVLSYLANTIRIGDREIPYSLVTAFDEEQFKALAGSRKTTHSALSVSEDTAGSAPPMLLNEWAAADLNAKPGDRVTIEYYLWREEGRLETASAQFVVAGIIPIEGAAADRDLVPDYPGISDTESLSDWDPPFPVDLKRVRPKDDDYWKQYRTTPKAFIPLVEGQKLWQSRHGKATSLRVYPQGDLQSALASYKTKLRAALDPIEAGMGVFAVKAAGVQASQGATDFGAYFFYFSFFLVVSALLLASLFFKLGIEQRLREIGLLRAIGFSSAKVRNLFLVEGAVLSSIGSFLGILGAVGFAWLLMYGLRTWWVGAIGTTQLRLHVAPLSLVAGIIGGIVAALLCVALTVRTLRASSARALLAGESASSATKPTSPRRLVALSPRLFSSRLAAIVFGALGIALLVCAALNLIGQTAGFFGAGTLLLIALLCAQAAWLRGNKKSLIYGRGVGAVSSIGFRNATYRPARSVLCIALIAAAAFIIVAVDAFRKDAQADNPYNQKSGTGGYPLVAEAMLPIHHDPSTEAGREELTLIADSNFSPNQVAFTRFRVREGEDASCLNLYQPRSPRIFGATDEFIKGNRFAFAASLSESDEEKANPWLLLDKELADGAIPVIVDANSLTYVLHLKLGDDFLLPQESGEPVRLRIVGALADSILKSEFVMSEKNFLRLFTDEGGYKFFLLDVAPEDQARATAALEEKLADFGFDITSTAERLASFHRVENTYISTFQTLGAFGLLLGTVGLATVLFRNVLERRKELALLRAVGYNSNHFALMVLAENLMLLVCGLLTGTACALLAIAPAFLERGGRLPTVSLGFLLLAVLLSGLIASVLATLAALRSPLLPALRAE